MKKIGMVIINYNDAKTTTKLLDNIKKYKVLDKIVVVDNKSTDNSVSILKKYESKKIVILENNENKGYASGLNFGAKYLLDKIGDCNIIFSNSDIIIESEKDLSKLNSYITDEHPVVGPTIIQGNELNRGWMMPTPFTEICANLPLISRKLNKRLFYKDNYYKNETSEVDVVSGCFFLVNGEVLKKINYFDENTFLYYEENILAKKIKDRNMSELVVNNIDVVHNHSVTIDKSVKKINKYKILKKSQSYFVKNYLDANIIQRLFLYITYLLSLVILHIRCIFN